MLDILEDVAQVDIRNKVAYYTFSSFFGLFNGDAIPTVLP